MMNWSLAFDYATILLLSILVIWFLTERRVPLKSPSVYFGLVVLLFVCTTLEIFASYFSSNPPKETNVPFSSEVFSVTSDTRIPFSKDAARTTPSR